MNKVQTTEDYLKKGGKIKVLPPFAPKLRNQFGKVKHKTGLKGKNK